MCYSILICNVYLFIKIMHTVIMIPYFESDFQSDELYWFYKTVEYIMISAVQDALIIREHVFIKLINR